jgi:hypothetical protein
MPDDIDTGFDTIRIYTPDANDDGGVEEEAELVDETFEAYSDAENPDGQSEEEIAWDVDLEKAGPTVAVTQATLGGVASKWLRFYKTSAMDAWIRVWGEFDEPSDTPDAQNHVIYYDLYIAATRANLVFSKSAKGTYPPTINCGICGVVGAKWRRMSSIGDEVGTEIKWGGASGANVAASTLYNCAVKFYQQCE